MKLVLVLFAFLCAVRASAMCSIVTPGGHIAFDLDDALFKLIDNARSCPKNVFDLKKLLQADGLHAAPSMVANRGRHNPKQGSFSFFETVSGSSKKLQREVKKGEFFFGHFTSAHSGEVELDQSPRHEQLLIELIAWDSTKELFNFYELIGSAQGATWFYRGDSQDAYHDNQRLHLQLNPQKPQFGNRMRCSACHVSGGPIMKELAAPHNDWWRSERPLGLGTLHPSEKVLKWLSETVDASEFATAVTNGIQQLAASEKMQRFQRQLSLREQLRPLFCTQEINIISAMEAHEQTGENFSLSSSYFLNPLLFAEKRQSVGHALYNDTVRTLAFHFPETNHHDADHPWLAPVKGYSDLVAIKGLISQGVVDEHFALEILHVDFREPLFSFDRCELLRLVPAEGAERWQQKFKEALKKSSNPFAPFLLEHLGNPNRKEKREQELKATLRLLAPTNAEQMQRSLERLAKLRVAVLSDEISKNPRGQILEPGFRVVFPVRD